MERNDLYNEMGITIINNGEGYQNVTSTMVSAVQYIPQRERFYVEWKRSGRRGYYLKISAEDVLESYQEGGSVGKMINVLKKKFGYSPAG